MSATSLTLTTFAAGVLAVLGLTSLVFDLFWRDRSRINRRLHEEFRSGSGSRGGRSSLFKNIEELLTDPGSQHFGLRPRLQLLIEQAGMQIPAGRLLSLCGGSAAAVSLASLVCGAHWGAAVPAGLLGFVIPLGYILGRRQRRLTLLSQQLPEAFDVMCRAVQAGQTLSAALRVAAESGTPPLSAEFAHCCEQQSLGLPQDVALRDLARRNGIMELQMFAVALLLQRQAGGSPCELLENLADLVRKRLRLKLKVRALTSEGRMQAVVLSVLPLIALGMLYLLNRGYAEILLTRHDLLLATFAAQGVGCLWIRKIVNFEF